MFPFVLGIGSDGDDASVGLDSAEQSSVVNDSVINFIAVVLVPNGGSGAVAGLAFAHSGDDHILADVADGNNVVNAVTASGNVAGGNPATGIGRDGDGQVFSGP